MGSEISISGTRRYSRANPRIETKSASARRYKPSRPRLLSTDQEKRRVQLDFLVPDLLESQPLQLCCIVQWRAVGAEKKQDRQHRHWRRRGAHPQRPALEDQQCAPGAERPRRLVDELACLLGRPVEHCAVQAGIATAQL